MGGVVDAEGGVNIVERYRGFDVATTENSLLDVYYG